MAPESDRTIDPDGLLLLSCAKAMISPAEALERLRAGNRRFVASVRDHSAVPDSERRKSLAAGQEPFAIVLGCSDSRVPAELVFDQGFGDLFVIRVAGNIVAPSQVGRWSSRRRASARRSSSCSGTRSAGRSSRPSRSSGSPRRVQSRNLRSIVDRIRPCVEPLLTTELAGRPEELVASAVRANIRAAAAHLRTGSEIFENLVRAEKLLVVGAEYSLDSSVVEFFDGIAVGR